MKNLVCIISVIMFSSLLISFIGTTETETLNHETQQQSDSDISYVAAVVEYKPNGTPWDTPTDELILKNVLNYVNLIQEAASLNSEIIVFPEYGITTLGIPGDRQAAKLFLLAVPPIGFNPCENVSNNSAEANISGNPIELLSCAARSNEIYVVVNLGEILPCTREENSDCPDDGDLHYNANVVFDRNGKIVAKYHKTKLYFENQFDSPTIPEMSTFETDFGVTFGQIICFDIMFDNPAVELVAQGIQNIIFTSAWVDELPFLMAIQAHALWASSARVNLLASGYHQPIGGQLGSGIYSGRTGALNYTFDSESGTQLVIARVPKIPATDSKIPTFARAKSSTHHKLCSKLLTDSTLQLKKPENALAYHSYLQENLTTYSSTILNLQNQNFQEICHANFCCSIHYSASKKIKTDSRPNNITPNFRLIAFNGMRKVAAETDEFGWQVCGLIRCVNSSLESCSMHDRENNEDQLEKFTEFKLRGEPFVDEFVMRPTINTLDTNFDLISFGLFKINESSGIYEVSSNQLANIAIQSISIINRTYKTKY